jgi:hypothetical protein
VTDATLFVQRNLLDADDGKGATTSAFEFCNRFGSRADLLREGRVKDNRLDFEGDVAGCSLRARMALEGVSWVRSGLVEIAVGRRIAASAPSSAPSLGRRSRLGARFGLLSGAVLVGYADLNSVPCRSMACMMIASRRASAIRAFRRLDLSAIANAQSFSFSGAL